MSMAIFSVMFYSKPYVIGCKLITSLLNLLALLDLLLLVSESLSDILWGAFRWNSETQSVFIKSIWSVAPFVAVKGLCSLSPIDSNDSLCQWQLPSVQWQLPLDFSSFTWLAQRIRIFWHSMPFHWRGLDSKIHLKTHCSLKKNRPCN